MQGPPWFPAFLEPGADRFGILLEALAACGADPRPVELAGGRFIVVAPRRDRVDPHYRLKAISAHYDRVPGTPGALDNSAACLQIWRFLSEARDSFNTMFFLTDREELAGADPGGQGSYALGRALSGLGYGAPMVFALDVTGRGDALVLSRAAEALAGDTRMGAGLRDELGSMADGVLRLMAGRARVYRAHIPFGEDLGFMLAGLPALAITILPRDEAAALSGEPGLPPWASLRTPGPRRPNTWSCLHTADDLPSLYTDEAFALADRLLGRLAAWRVPRPLAEG